MDTTDEDDDFLSVTECLSPAESELLRYGDMHDFVAWVLKKEETPGTQVKVWAKDRQATRSPENELLAVLHKIHTTFKRSME